MFKKKISSPRHGLGWRSVLSGAIALTVVGTMLLGLSSCSLFGGNKQVGALYIKDQELFFSKLNDEDSLEISKDLFGSLEMTNSLIASNTDFLQSLFTLSSDGKTLFFPDKFGGEYSLTYSLYFRDLTKPEAEAVKIASDVTGYYWIDNDAAKVAYRKDTDDTLYLYDVKTETAEKIDDHVDDFVLAENGSHLLYATLDNIETTVMDLYVYTGEEKNKLASDVDEIQYICDDDNTVFYVNDENELYRASVLDGTKTKIASDVRDDIFATVDDTFYFARSEEVDVLLSDLITDDMAEADETLRQSSDFDLEAMLQLAYRDALREQMDTHTVTLTVNDLFYYNGSEALPVADDFVSWNDAAASASVIAFWTRSSEKVKMSELSSFELSDMATTLESAWAKEYYVAIKEEATKIDCNDAASFVVNGAGTMVLFVNDVDDETRHGDLYQINIKDGKADLPTKYDSDVYTLSVFFGGDDQFEYCKDVNLDTDVGDWYVNGTKVSSDVYLWNTAYHEDSDMWTYYVDWNSDDDMGTLKVYKDGTSEKISDDVYSYQVSGKRVIYMADWDADKEYGTLKVFEKGASTNISDDVYEYQVNEKGEILYLKDYSTTSYRGDLYLYRKGESHKVDTDVITIINFYG